VRDRGVLIERGREREERGVFVLTEIGRFEEFLDRDHLRTARRCFADECFGACDVAHRVGRTRHLRGGERDGSQADSPYVNER
jgi:hypothetical protein